MAKLLMVLPFLPILSRGILLVSFRRLARERLSESELARDQHRAVILIFAGFSFTATLALIVLDPHTQIDLGLATYFVLLSFSISLVAINIQSYKSSRWQDQLATALSDVATLSLALALAVIAFQSSFAASFRVILSGIALVPWFLDHVLRLALQAKYLREVRSNAR